MLAINSSDLNKYKDNFDYEAFEQLFDISELTQFEDMLQRSQYSAFVPYVRNASTAQDQLQKIDQCLNEKAFDCVFKSYQPSTCIEE